jgi:hypothetical protein
MTPIQILEHSFTSTIRGVLSKNYGAYSELIFNSSHILAYLNLKTKSANQGSKARGAFANHYALYVVIEDYIKNGFNKPDSISKYSNYEGARFSDLFVRQRQLPFGSKLQNHALNARLNDEFEKFFPTLGKTPIVRDVEKQRYWFQEDLLNVTIRNSKGEDLVFNIASSVLEIIDAYVATKLEAFEGFIDTCKQISELANTDSQKAIDFVIQQLQPNVDARIFEIVSFAVLKAKYGLDTVWIGDTKDEVEEEELILYKTGRTNANDGGIDFVMKPLGRFFQVTETVDVTKYFLDIDKVQRFPITFVVKSNDSEDVIKNNIKLQALSKYKISSVVESYMLAVEEVINVNKLIEYFTSVVNLGKVTEVMSEIVRQSKVEFNYEDED